MSAVPVAAGLGWPGSDGVPSGGLGWPTARPDPAGSASPSHPTLAAHPEETA